MSFAPPPLLTTPAFLNPPTPTSRPRTALARPPRMSLSSSDRPALVHEPVVYNVALGSNMDAAKLVSRKNSDGTFIAPLDDGVPCTVRDWAMTFDYLAMPPREPVMSCGVPRKGDVLHGVLYKLSNESYQALAKSEGCLNPNSLYKEFEVLAEIYPGLTTALPSTPIRALLFGLRHPASLPKYLYPSARYMEILLSGARSANLAPSFVERLEATRVARPLSRPLRGFSFFAIIGMFFLLRWPAVTPLARKYYTPVLARLCSWKEAALQVGMTGRAALLTGAMVAFMLPMACLGFLRAIVQRRNVLKIARGD